MDGSWYWPSAWPNPLGGIDLTIQTESSTIVAAYDAVGRLRDGWPLAVPLGGCTLRFAEAGSIRLTCEEVGTGGRWAFAFDVEGRGYAGWPVAIPYGDEAIDGPVLVIRSGTATTRVRPNGAITSTPLPAATAAPEPAATWGPEEDCHFSRHAAPSGWALVWADCIGTAADTPRAIHVYDAAGRLVGRPVVLAGALSVPTFDSEGRAYLVNVTDGSSSRLVAIGPDGLVPPGWPIELPDSPPHVGSWAESYTPMPLLIDATDRLHFVTERTVWAIERTGDIVQGWPYREPVGLAAVDTCGPCDNDCLPYPTWPLLGSGGTLYLVGSATATTGDRVTAIGRDGSVLPGWPKTLRRPGSVFVRIAAGPDGTLYATARELEGPATPAPGRCYPDWSMTVLAIARDGSVRYRISAVEPR